MLTEAHKALRREIKSIRRALKKLVRQFYDYADAQESTAPEWSDVSSIPDSVNGGDNAQISKDNVTKLEEDFGSLTADESEVEALRNVCSPLRHRTNSYGEHDKKQENDDVFAGKQQRQFTRLHRSTSSPPSTYILENRDKMSPQNGTSPRNGHRHLSRSATQPSIQVVKQDLPTQNRSLSTNSDTFGPSSVEDTTFFDVDSSQFNNTYPGASSVQNDNDDDIHQKRPTTPRKHLSEVGRRTARLHFSESDLDGGLKYPRDFVFDNADTNGIIPPELEPQLTELPPDDRIKQTRPPPLQRRFTQEQIRQAGSQLRIPSTRQMKRAEGMLPLGTRGSYQIKPTHQPAEQPPPIPHTPPPDEDTSVLQGLEDQLGVLPEFPNSFQSLPRRLSSSEISAIGGGGQDKRLIPRLKKLIRSSTQPITVAEIAI